MGVGEGAADAFKILTGRNKKQSSVVTLLRFERGCGFVLGRQDLAMGEPLLRKQETPVVPEDGNRP